MTAGPLEEHHPDISLAIGEKHRIATAFGTSAHSEIPWRQSVGFSLLNNLEVSTLVHVLYLRSIGEAMLFFRGLFYFG